MAAAGTSTQYAKDEGAYPGNYNGWANVRPFSCVIVSLSFPLVIFSSMSHSRVQHRRWSGYCQLENNNILSSDTEDQDLVNTVFMVLLQCFVHGSIGMITFIPA